MFEWKSVVRTVAPALAAAFGTPLAGVATKVIADALLGDDTPEEITDEVLATAVQAATPDQLIELKKAGLQFEKEMAALGVDLEKLANEDRANARQREISTSDVWTPRALAGTVTLGFFGVLAWLLWKGIPTSGGEALLVMLGSLGTAWASIIAYFFGSTAGSARKTNLLAQQEARR